MSYTDEALKAKLSTLNETQDSIVSVSQWIMFHKRHADRIANYWLTRLRDSPPPKRLNYIYLVNDTVQNARARKRNEFPDAFSPLMPEAIQTAYRSSPPDIQQKIRRVVEVWRTRNVFEIPILDAIDARTDEIDKAKGSGGKKTLMGQSLFGSSSSGAQGMPKELETLGPLQIAVTKETIAARPVLDTAQVEYMKLTDPEAKLPSPPVHAARLSSLIKSLAAAESSVSASIKARKSLIEDLERIVEINKDALAKDEDTYLTLDSRKTSTEAKKREVEDAIIRGLSSAETATSIDNIAIPGDNAQDLVQEDGTANAGSISAANAFFSDRPEIEQFTDDEAEDDFTVGRFDQDQEVQPESHPTSAPAPSHSANPALAAALAEFSSSGASLSDYSAFLPTHTSSTNTNVRVRSASNTITGPNGSGGGGAKRRKTSHGAEDEQVPDFGDMGMEGEFAQQGQGQRQEYGSGAVYDGYGAEALSTLDADVDELLRQEGARGGNGTGV